MGHETSTSREWSRSLTATVGAGFEAKGVGFSAEVSREVAEAVAEAVTDSLTATQTHEIQYEYTEDNIGKTLWQFVFAPEDSCHNQEIVITKEIALTEGAFREPCCLPGWALDAPAYTQCATADSLISTDPTSTTPAEPALNQICGACNRNVPHRSAGEQG